jgi:hypothetical protein
MYSSSFPFSICQVTYVTNRTLWFDDCNLVSQVYDLYPVCGLNVCELCERFSTANHPTYIDFPPVFLRGNFYD